MKKPRSKVQRYVLIAVVLLIIAFGVRAAFFSSPPPPTFAVAEVVRGNLEDSVLASGTMDAIERVSVGAQATGQLKSLKVALGDRVTRGQLVAEIDDLTQQNELRNTQAALQTRRAERAAKVATLKQAELAFRRQRQMLAADASSREAYESAEATLSVTRAEIAALDAQIVQAEIEVDKAKVNLGYTRIVSPIDGVVVAVVTKEGQTVNAIQSAPTIIKVAQVATMTIKAQISEADVTRVKPGLPVYFTILGEPDQRYHATLRAVEPAPDSIQKDDATASLTSSSSTSTSAAVYYNGLFDVPNPDEKLRISMTAQVSIVLGEARDAVVVPASALGKRGQDGRYEVRVVGKNNQTETRQVRIGMNNNVQAQVLEGLEVGERVVSADAAPVAAAAGR
ncbi:MULTISPECIES: efflux RND transporter periplasmic adaptor subunit [Achromobacter]|jgi:membrane fusion protein, macrolide-specific efflux system|uniref:Efflux RND transporter periplasmic adaptor subunit n=3 Tax=Achromobacter TaxID=222 RepID=A0A1D8IHW3_9BURK|nr:MULTISPECIES: efflux RND transporter periplasmic adaptor subunit [Achromobacter]AKP88465.1 Macrolide-specific efflux protein MacA [Achromobacter xylosoxidans]AOU96048.1 macrolide transporter subunit MacA [Achromobacter ruhlandii]MCI1839780.1 efflux RND transporter periplasmic adaptor subunit [Achromobacter ruhlandii]MCZ8433813.1 efflux RND transporter periplasmic adaptor subunit [Achromobacter ruhlandii]MDC6090575.1 efflux RND transporter periplasmic adaptor subunit [Achromobacter ruhlandii